jgi:7-cyano-7-deazaguanine reductase
VNYKRLSRGEKMKYGEKIVNEFDVEKDLEIWPNEHEREYLIKMTLPEFSCLCPRSGYPDYATIYLEYTPDKWVVELKAIKLYINSFRDKHISHENTANEIYDLLERKLKPKYMKITADFNPRGNVHTVIEIDSSKIVKK